MILKAGNLRGYKFIAIFKLRGELVNMELVVPVSEVGLLLTGAMEGYYA
jgi:hypothetical protein